MGPRETRDDDETRELVSIHPPALPLQHLAVLRTVIAWTDQSAEIVQPVSTEQVQGAYEPVIDNGNELSTRAIRDVLRDLETMRLVEIWTESRGRDGRDGRVKQIEPMMGGVYGLVTASVPMSM